MRGTQSVIANRDNSSNDGNSIVASLCLHLVSFAFDDKLGLSFKAISKYPVVNQKLIIISQLVYHISEKITPPPFFDQWLAQVPRSFGNKIQLSKYMVEVLSLIHI